MVCKDWYLWPCMRTSHHICALARTLRVVAEHSSPQRNLARLIRRICLHECLVFEQAVDVVSSNLAFIMQRCSAFELVHCTHPAFTHDHFVTRYIIDVGRVLMTDWFWSMLT
ncbi:hypothetical protein C8Q74DRAFT_854130 [Fomes fomentarius]|nr:hypothetical protein C8Q74DRAFT_854130 [Fomes fomentarius]